MSFDNFATYREIKSQTEAWSQALDLTCSIQLPKADRYDQVIFTRCGGAYYSTLATQLINSHFNNLGQIHVVNTRNDGAVQEWPADWVLELPARVDGSGIHPLPADPLPPACFGLVAQVKMYEILTIEAAVHGDRNALYQALLTHPLGPNADQVQAVMDDILNTNNPWLPQFRSSHEVLPRR